jgi:hypothetical protein
VEQSPADLELSSALILIDQTSAENLREEQVPPWPLIRLRELTVTATSQITGAGQGSDTASKILPLKFIGLRDTSLASTVTLAEVGALRFNFRNMKQRNCIILVYKLDN